MPPAQCHVNIIFAVQGAGFEAMDWPNAGNLQVVMAGVSVGELCMDHMVHTQAKHMKYGQLIIALPAAGMVWRGLCFIRQLAGR